MAEDHIGQPKETKAPWTTIFTAFKVALDVKKLLLAAAGIVVMAFGWWFFAVVFYNMRSKPTPEDYISSNLKTPQEKEEGWKSFQQARQRWNLLHELAGPAPESVDKAIREDAADMAQSFQEYEEISKLERAPGKIKPFGKLRTWPWFEDRGPNPYLLVTGNIKAGGVEGAPWVRGQLYVLVEPLVKFLSPILYFFDPGAGGLGNRIYLICVILWTLATWGFFGGAITRMAAVQIARNEKVSMTEALKFAKERFQSFFSAPVFPLLFLGVLTFILILFGVFSGLIPVIGDILIAGLLWPLVLVLGLVMAVVLVGLVGWPMMNATISSEGSDSFDALSRSYSYVYQAPWHYLWYSAVALAYGAVLVFFVGLMGSLMVYLGQWGISQAPFLAGNETNDREPTYLFVNAPTSFGWRDLLLNPSPFKAKQEVVAPSGNIIEPTGMSDKYMKNMTWYNSLGGLLVSAWLYLFFLLIVGFGYSYFWTASTIIYLLMRKKLDDTDMDEIHLEEDDMDEPFAKDMTPPAAKPAEVGGGMTMVEAPALRGNAPPPVASPSEAGAENKISGDGTAPPQEHP